MKKNKFYNLPDLPYGYHELEPYISREQLEIHHKEHHAVYVNGANSILENIDEAREKEKDLDIKCVLKSFAFNIGGHILHNLYWQNMAPSKKDGGGEPSQKLKEIIIEEFGSFANFKKEFSQNALSIEGSGWVALSYCQKTNRPILMQIEKHNVNVYPTFNMLLVLDMWEHAYYIDRKNKKKEHLDAFWKIANWEEAEKRLHNLIN